MSLPDNDETLFLNFSVDFYQKCAFFIKKTGSLATNSDYLATKQQNLSRKCFNPRFFHCPHPRVLRVSYAIIGKHIHFRNNKALAAHVFRMEVFQQFNNRAQTAHDLIPRALHHKKPKTVPVNIGCATGELLLFLELETS